jgi:phage terminase small subunit
MSDIPPTEPRAKRHLRVIAGKDTKGRDKAQEAGAQAPSVAAKQKTRVRSPIDPITGITAKQEAFVQGVASGLSLSAAYRAAFVADGMADQTVHHHACVLLTQGKVKARLEMISAEKEQMRRMLAVSDVEAALRTLRAINDSGSESGKLRAAELLAKAGGLWVDRIEVEDKTPADTAEVERRIAERLSRLGLTG